MVECNQVVVGRVGTCAIAIAAGSEETSAVQLELADGQTASGVADSEEEVWGGCGKMGKGLEGLQVPRQWRSAAVAQEVGSALLPSRTARFTMTSKLPSASEATPFADPTTTARAGPPAARESAAAAVGRTAARVAAAVGAEHL